MLNKKLLLVMNKQETSRPVVNDLISKYNLTVNIFRAQITPSEQGYMVIDVAGSEENYKKALEFLALHGISANEKTEGVLWDKDICVSCGNCISHCPSGALHLEDTRSRKVCFDNTKCIECLNCIPNCPYKACSALF